MFCDHDYKTVFKMTVPMLSFFSKNKIVMEEKCGECSCRLLRVKTIVVFACKCGDIMVHKFTLRGRCENPECKKCNEIIHFHGE